MKSRIPFAAAVVGALLVGGATTGGTYASWTDQRPLAASSVSSGQMSYTASSPAGVTVARSAGATADSTLVLDDTSVGKNLGQRITATVTSTPAGVSATVGTACPGASTVSVDTTPTGADRALCVRVSSSTTAVTGTVVLTLRSVQRPVAGWTTAATTRSIAVTVTEPGPVVPVLQCDGSASPGPAYRVAWAATGASSYRVHTSSSATTGFTVAGTVASGTTFTSTGWARNEVRYVRVTAVTGTTESAPSNTLEVERNGSSDNFKCGPAS